MLEERAKPMDRKTYYSERKQSEDGRTQAALMYVRGIVHHREANVAGELLTPLTLAGVVREDRSIEPIEHVWYFENGERVGLIGNMYELSRPWPPLSQLPEPLISEKHGRDSYYAAYVQGKALMEPLLAAERFLRSVLNSPVSEP